MYPMLGCFFLWVVCASEDRKSLCEVLEEILNAGVNWFWNGLLESFFLEGWSFVWFIKANVW